MHTTSGFLALIAALSLRATLAAAQASPADTSASRDSLPRRGPVPPIPGQVIRVSAPTLPAPDNRLQGVFLGIDSLVGAPLLQIGTKDGERFVPCEKIELVELQRV
ncbi:MAG TPA: hypothetical protein VHM30_14995, partial [Gemmatimonadaceae bacterium]|nr:hypothetical protein [Gemmatimonadaceae bacterium]